MPERLSVKSSRLGDRRTRRPGVNVLPEQIAPVRASAVNVVSSRVRREARDLDLKRG
jgi:hypothetical protein